MDTENAREKYLSERWQSQRDYYSRQSAHNKRWYQTLQLFIGLGAVIVPVLLGVPEVPKLVPTVVSTLVAGAAVVENVYHFGDNWRNFRVTLESLKRERVWFDTNTGPYQDPHTGLSVFVERVEGLIASETREYFPEEWRAAKQQVQNRNS